MESVRVVPTTIDIDIGEAGRRWLAHLEAIRRRRSTLMDYESAVRIHLVPFFGSRPIGKITAADVEAFMAAKRAEGRLPKSVARPGRQPRQQRPDGGRDRVLAQAHRTPGRHRVGLRHERVRRRAVRRPPSPARAQAEPSSSRDGVSASKDGRTAGRRSRSIAGCDSTTEPRRPSRRPRPRDCGLSSKATGVRWTANGCLARLGPAPTAPRARHSVRR